MDSIVSINTDGLAKLGEVIAHCTGWNARGIKKDAEAQYYADELAIKSANNIAFLKEQGADALADYILQREQRKATNVATIVQKATEQFVPNEQVPEEVPSQDWLNRYFDYAENISEAEMQNLWAKLLADEIKKPRTFSKRTLDVIRNLSSDEAQLMNKYAGRVIGDALPYMDTDDKVDDMSKLDDAGMINSECLIRSLEVTPEKSQILCGDQNLVLIVSAENKVHISYNMRLLTEAGKQIIDLISPNMDMSFMEKFAENLTRTGAIVSLHQVINKNDKSYRYMSNSIWTKGKR